MLASDEVHSIKFVFLTLNYKKKDGISGGIFFFETDLGPKLSLVKFLSVGGDICWLFTP